MPPAPPPRNNGTSATTDRLSQSPRVRRFSIGLSGAEIPRNDTMAHFFNMPITLFGNVYTIHDVLNSGPTNLTRLRDRLLRHIQGFLFGGAPITDENINQGITRSIEELGVYLEPLSQFDLPDYDIRRSVENLIKDYLSTVFLLIRDDRSAEFITRLHRSSSVFIKRLITMLVTCVGRADTLLYFTQLIHMLVVSHIFLGPESSMMRLIGSQIDSILEGSFDVSNFIVIRCPPAAATATEVTVQTAPQEPAAAMETDDGDFEDVSTMVVESEEIVVATEVAAAPAPPPIVDNGEEPIPSVMIGTEPWHYNFPTSSWIPVITRDMGRQRRQHTQPPFSDAYLSGMSSKRRKIISDKKSSPDVTSMINDGVRHALHSSGINTNNGAVSVDDITTAISNDTNVQNSYKETLKSTVQERLQNDPEFNPDRFPNSSKYFNNKK